MKISTKTNSLEELGTAIGVGLIAGLVGTVAITVSQMIEMKITKREPSSAPVDAVAKVLDVKATSKEQKSKVAQEVHWTYGTSWGMVRGLLTLIGLKRWKATTAHFLGIWAAEQVMLPSLKLAKPINEQEPETIGIDVLHHAVYAIAAGLTYDAIKTKNVRIDDNKLLAKMKRRLS